MSEVTVPLLGRKMMYRAHKRDDGVVVCIDTDYLGQTSRIVVGPREREIALENGWADDPQTAMREFERAEELKGERAAVRAFDDRRVTLGAQMEVEAVESQTLEHLDVISEAPRKRGRPKKPIVQ